MNSVKRYRSHQCPSRARVKPAGRSGTILICVLACLVVTSSLLVSMVQTVLRDRSQTRLERQLRQTELLCEAGVMRASTQLNRSEDYDGEVWTPELSQTSWSDAAVEIRVTAAEDTTAKRVEVIARLGAGGDKANNVQPIQRSHTFIFEKASNPSSSEKR